MSDKGAHFFRCDLQVHTPRDINWAGKDAVTDDERRAYAKSLVQACRDRGLQGVAVTDHHDMLFVSYVRKTAAEETDAEGEAAGIKTMRQVAALDVEQLVKLGVQRRFAQQIRAYVSQRQR